MTDTPRRQDILDAVASADSLGVAYALLSGNPRPLSDVTAAELSILEAVRALDRAVRAVESLLAAPTPKGLQAGDAAHLAAVGARLLSQANRQALEGLLQSVVDSLNPA